MTHAARPTLEDVARLAGVSLGSASRALSVPDQVKPGTLEKVQRAVEQLGYVRNGAAQALASYTVYRWECAVRASVVMGFVGAGGLGQLMDQSMKMLNGGEACTILLVFLLLVLAADALSAALRRLLA